MKTKLTALLLCAVLLLTACTAAQKGPTAPAYPQSVETTDGHIRIGKFHSELPDAFTVTYSDDETLMVSSKDNYCIISILVFDMSDASEIEIQEHVSDATSDLNDASEMEVAFSDIDPMGYMWVEMSETMQPIACTRTVFTDSWYVYQVDQLMLPGYYETNVLHDAIAFLMSFEADDVPARFDFVQ